MLDLSDPYFLSVPMILARSESSINGIRELLGKKVAMLEGSLQEKDLEQIWPHAVKIIFKTLADALNGKLWV